MLGGGGGGGYVKYFSKNFQHCCITCSHIHHTSCLFYFLCPDTYAVYFQCHVLPSEPRSEFCVRSKTNNGTTDLLEAVVNL